jgi:isopentenyl phosphate kinase
MQEQRDAGCAAVSMNDLYFIKLGGSVITDTEKPKTPKREEIARLLNEILSAQAENSFTVVIGHGSGSFGHSVAKQYRVQEGLCHGESKKGAAETRQVARELNSILIETGLHYGMPLMAFSPSSFAVAKGRRLVQGTSKHIDHAISQGFIPVVYGDVVTDLDQGVSIASTEEAFRFLTQEIKPTKIVLGTDVDGVFDSDPTKNPGARLIKEVNGKNIETVLSGAAGAHKIDVTGGMKTKLSILYEMVKATGATGYILNASKPGTVKKVLAGKENEVLCTRVVA